ncbi:17515_t:CDS:2 [Acaulospora colombiana]|uniref:17515_t:CDS:1 n=1 Tax=Acaulospora colombiana TaxID=27376 RepID=A0ACA9KMU3_9GLOM|nr:17515_t:CDS:2 [Acaulospora colombiana]
MNNTIKNSLDNNIPKRKCMTPTCNIDPLKHYSSAIRATKRAINASKNNNSEDVFSRLPAITSSALQKITSNRPCTKDLQKLLKTLIKEKLFKLNDIIIQEVQKA